MKFSKLLYFSVLFLAAIAPLPCHAATFQDEAPKQDAPTKGMLIELLNHVQIHLEKKNYQAAGKSFKLPPNFDVLQLSRILDNQECSAEGIKTLENSGKFGTAIELFGAERAKFFADRFGVVPKDCYGFRHEANGQTAEVLVHWNGKTMQLIRIDDVGKIATAAQGKGTAAMEDQEGSEPETSVNPLKMTKEEVAQRLADWIKTEKENPQSPLAKVNLAMAQFRLGNYPVAWRLLLDANKLAPGTVGIERGIRNVFRQFRDLAVLSIGVPDESIIGLLGEPDQKVKLSDTSERYVYGFYGIDFAKGRIFRTVDLRGIQENVFNIKESVNLSFPTGWNCGYRYLDKSSAMAVHLPPGQMISQWTEKVEIQTFPGTAGQITTEGIVQLAAKEIKQLHPEAVSKKVESDANSVLLANHIPGKNVKPPQHQLVRFLIGRSDVHRIAITITGDEPSEATQASWSEILKNAKVDTDN